MTSEAKVLQKLRQNYRMALDRYMDVTGSCSGRLSRLTPETLSGIEYANLAVLERKEEMAREAYLKAKADLQKWLQEARDKPVTN